MSKRKPAKTPMNTPVQGLVTPFTETVDALALANNRGDKSLLDQTITVTIGDRKIVVGESDFITDIHMNMLISEINNKFESEIMPLITIGTPLAVHVSLTKFYAPMASCSKGDVPTILEYITWKSDQVDVWYQACLKKNPHMFDVQVSKEEAEKKSS